MYECENQGFNHPDNVLSSLTMAFITYVLCMYFSKNNVVVCIFTFFMRLSQNSLFNFTTSAVAEQTHELKATHLQSHTVLHSIRHNDTERSPQWSCHSRTAMTATMAKPKQAANTVKIYKLAFQNI